MQDHSPESDTEHAPALSTEDRSRIVRINTAIRAASRDLRQRHTWLRHQDAIGVALLCLSAAGMVGASMLYLTGRLPALLTVVLCAFAASIAHELEHDLIHRLYFRNRPVLNGAMMLCAWIMRPNTINPWSRRRMHLRHHQLSGTPDDLEERAITNGEPFNLKRLVMMADGLLAGFLRLDQAGKRKGKLVTLILASYFPLGWFHFAVWYAFLTAHVGLALGAIPQALTDVLPTLDVLVVCWIGPNVLRSFSLNFISSSMHYYGDVQARNVLQQTQVLNTPWLLPLQLFCFNFGSTHAAHHFVANEPFYIRQWTSPQAHRALRDNGVPFNDLGTFRRANRRGTSRQSAAVAANAALAQTS